MIIDTIKRTLIVSIDFHRLMEPIDINRLIFIDYIDYIDWFQMIDFHRLDTSGYSVGRENYASPAVLLSSGTVT